MKLTLFGKFCFSDETSQTCLPRLGNSPKLQELLAYLLVYADCPLLREEIAADLWNEQSASQAFANVRKSLNLLESLLGQKNLHFLNTPGCVEWKRSENLWTDIHQLEGAMREASSGFEELIERPSLASLLAAADLYRGPFLDGCYSPWCLEIRRRLEQTFLQFLETLMEACERRGDDEAVLRLGQRALGLERSRESVHRRLMRLFYRLGDRTTALRQYQRCADALAEELEVKPDSETVLLYRQIQRGGQLPYSSVSALPMSFQKILINLQSLDRFFCRLREMEVVSPESTQPFQAIGSFAADSDSISSR